MALLWGKGESGTSIYAKRKFSQKGIGVHPSFRVMRLGKLYGFTDKLFVGKLFSIECEALLSVCNQICFSPNENRFSVTIEPT